jgi:hypothetical protein
MTLLLQHVIDYLLLTGQSLPIQVASPPAHAQIFGSAARYSNIFTKVGDQAPHPQKMAMKYPLRGDSEEYLRTANESLLWFYSHIFEGVFNMANETFALFKIGRMLGHQLSDLVYKEHWGIRAIVFAKHRADRQEAFRMENCGEELTNQQKEWIQQSRANLQVELRTSAYQKTEDERNAEERQIVARDKANLIVARDARDKEAFRRFKSGKKARYTSTFRCINNSGQLFEGQSGTIVMCCGMRKTLGESHLPKAKSLVLPSEEPYSKRVSYIPGSISFVTLVSNTFVFICIP